MNFHKLPVAALSLLLTAMPFVAHAEENWADDDAKAVYEKTPEAHTGNRPEIKMLWVPLNRVATYTLLKQSFEKPCADPVDGMVQPKLHTTIAPGMDHGLMNPFALADKDFRTGAHLTNQTAYGPIPTVTANDASWFDQQVADNNLPDVFMVGGHHVISEGWHNDPETDFLYMPTLLDTISKSDSARKIFDHVKLAVLWGCNTMTDLEPHGKNGEYLDSPEIESIYKSGPDGRREMLGLTSGEVKWNSLEFYKQRLASEYGIGTKSYEYTRKSAAERCDINPGDPFKNCPVTNLERIMPESYLFDGNHVYDEPMRMKQIFRNAYLVLGFSSASPSEEQRAKILSLVLKEATRDLNSELSANHQTSQDNILYTIIADGTEKSVRMKAIELVRKHWTIETYKLNRERPSGSITPAFPELDANGVFNTKAPEHTPLFAPYEQR
jgi:hypothetical protein